VWLHVDAKSSDDAQDAVAGAGIRFRKILVVDDDEQLRHALERNLRRERDVYTAATTVEAIALARAHEPTLALVDLQLGTESGIELVRELRAQHPELRIVVMTGFGSIDATVAAMRAGADDVIAKPFTSAEVIRRAGGAPTSAEFDTPSLERALWEHCSRVLAACGGNKSLAAAKLRMHRSRLRRLLAKGPPEK
jgi:two-component system response regulator RegA